MGPGPRSILRAYFTTGSACSALRRVPSAFLAGHGWVAGAGRHLRILLINNLFHPEPNHLKGMTFVHALQNRGHEVLVLTGFPNYPGGEVYPGYRVRWRQDEVVEGVRIRRVAMYPSHNRSAIGRSLNFLTLGLSMLVHAPFLRERFDVCYIYLGPITLAWPALYLKWVHGTPLIADVQDIWPESVADSGMLRSPLPMALIRSLTEFVYKRVSRFVVLSDGYGKSLERRGIAANRISVIHNWTDERSLAADDTDQSGDGSLPPNTFTILYAGNMGETSRTGHGP